ncbi:MAG: MFS transporter, partial [Beijerinckiaceae bacterium]
MPDHLPVTPESPVSTPPSMTPRLLAILGVCAFASAASMRILDPVMPLLATDFQRSIQETALLTTYFTMAYALGQPFLGPIGDSFGKARMISLALGVMGLFLLLAAAAGSFGMFAVARALTGIA